MYDRLCVTSMTVKIIIMSAKKTEFQSFLVSITVATVAHGIKAYTRTIL